MAFVDFSELKTQELFRIVPAPSWDGDVRLNKPDALTLLPIIQQQEKYKKDESGRFVNDKEALEFAATLLSQMIADEEGILQFDSDDGRERLTRDFGVISDLLEAAIKLCGISESQAKKKRKSMS